jgi:hypothetical protein
MKKKTLSLDDVERLSRGESSRSRQGSRAIPHRLTKDERQKFEAAKRRGYLKLPLRTPRDNLLNIYKLWCEATGRDFIVQEPKVKLDGDG